METTRGCKDKKGYEEQNKINRVKITKLRSKYHKRKAKMAIRVSIYLKSSTLGAISKKNTREINCKVLKRETKRRNNPRQSKYAKS